MPGGPGFGEINQRDAAFGIQVFLQAFQVGRLVGDVVQGVNDNDQVNFFGQLRIVFGTHNGFDFCQVLFGSSLFDVLDQFGVNVHGVHDTFCASLFSQRAREQAGAGTDVGYALAGLDLQAFYDFGDLKFGLAAFGFQQFDVVVCGTRSSGLALGLLGERYNAATHEQRSKSKFFEVHNSSDDG